MTKFYFMRNLFFIATLLCSFITLNSIGQTISSSLLNFELPKGSGLDTKADNINKYTRLLADFAADKGYKLKGSAEIIKTDLDAFKQKLSQHKFILVQEGSSDFYSIS